MENASACGAGVLSGGDLLSGAGSRGSSTGNVRNRILSERGATLNDQLESQLDSDLHSKALADLMAQFEQDAKLEVADMMLRLKMKRKGVRPVNPEMEAFVAAIEAARERKPGSEIAPPTAAEIAAEQSLQPELAATTTTPGHRLDAPQQCVRALQKCVAISVTGGAGVAGGSVLSHLRGEQGQVTIAPSAQNTWSETQDVITFHVFSTVGALELLTTSGVAYFEAVILEASSRDCYPQLGFATPAFVTGDDAPPNLGAGDDAHSWGLDGIRKLKWSARKGSPWSCTWKVGDTIGLAANVDLGKIAVSKNGSWTGEENGVVFTDAAIKQGVYPALTASKFKLRCAFSEFKYAPPPGDVWQSAGGAGGATAAGTEAAAISDAHSLLGWHAPWWSISIPFGSVEVASESLDAEEDEEIARLEAASAHPPPGLTPQMKRLQAVRLEALRERKTNRVPLRERKTNRVPLRPTPSPHAVVLGEALLPLLPLTALPSSQVPSRFLIAS
jgi:hypothetical protein